MPAFSLDKLRLRQQLGVLIGIALIMMAGTQLFFYFQFHALSRERAERYAESMVNRAAEQIYSNARNTEEGAATVAYNRHVQEYLTTEDPERKYIILFPFVRDVLEYVRSSNENIHDIALAGTDGKTIISLMSEYQYQFDIQRALVRDYKIGSPDLKAPVHTALLRNIDGAYYYAYILPIFSANPGISLFEKIGSCVVVSNVESLKEIVMDFSASDNSGFMILDRNNTIIAGNKAEEQGEIFESLYPFTLGEARQESAVSDNQKKTIVQYRLIQNSGWKVVSVIPERELSRDMRPIRNFGLLLGILMILVLALAASALIGNITRPVSKIVGFIEQIGNGGGRRLEMPAPNEVGIIAGYINRMLDKIEEDTAKLLETQKQLYELELSKKQAELSALQNQINPHFLYNTLNCISSIALVNDITEIVAISEAMVRIFRYSIKQSDLVRIRDELDLVKDYMEIMNIRYQGRFSFTIEAPEPPVERRVPKMILQPLVENADYHVLERKNGPGRLVIGVSEAGVGKILIRVWDDGKGMGAEELGRLRNALDGKAGGGPLPPEGRRSVGLFNINNRIKLMFGDGYGLSIDSRENEGTGVSILLPILPDGGRPPRNHDKIR
jgi:two-component system sensor histidine kinase YesM